MAVTKKEMELMGPLTAGQRWQVEALDRHIKECLEARYTPGGQVLVPVDYHMAECVSRVISIRWRDRGWEISFESDAQHDRYWIILK